MPTPPPLYLGEFEQLVLLAILRLGAEAHGVGIARELEAEAGRVVSRGALYTTLDRLEQKHLVRWKVAPGGEERARLPRRVYALTARGVASIRAAQHAFRQMARGLDGVLRGPTS
jgi:DNA-binding PadR family transcriptional regulator